MPGAGVQPKRPRNSRVGLVLWGWVAPASRVPGCQGTAHRDRPRKGHCQDPAAALPGHWPHPPSHLVALRPCTQGSLPPPSLMDRGRSGGDGALPAPAGEEEFEPSRLTPDLGHLNTGPSCLMPSAKQGSPGSALGCQGSRGCSETQPKRRVPPEGGRPPAARSHAAELPALTALSPLSPARMNLKVQVY